jgi:hypothetical protein
MLGINPPTAALLLNESIDLRPGDWVAQNAANSGVGRSLIAIAKARGLKTINFVRRPELVPELQAVGGDLVIVDQSEALDKIPYGTTRRRLRGDSYSKNEYDGCFPNAHGGKPIEVSAIVRLANGTEHDLTRRIPDPQADNASETFVDGKPAYFASVGVHALHAAHPVVAQHDLQSLIHSRPKERRDVISGALGLDELTALKTALDGARKSFAATAPPGVEEARAKLRPLANVLGNIAGTSSLGQRWQKAAVEVRADEDLQALIEAGQRLADSKAEDVEALLADLRPRRQQLSKNVFDTGQLSPPSDIAATVTRLATETTALTTASTSLAEHLASVIAAAAATYSTILLQFWETGLKLAPQGNEGGAR